MVTSASIVIGIKALPHGVNGIPNDEYVFQRSTGATFGHHSMHVGDHKVALVSLPLLMKTLVTYSANTCVEVNLLKVHVTLHITFVNYESSSSPDFSNLSLKFSV